MSEIRLDYDKIEFSDIKLIFEHRGWLVKYFNLNSVEVCKTRKGYHVKIVITKQLEPRDILLLQILLGSDINREIYNFVRQQNGELLKNWNRLYTKKYLVLGTKIVETLGEEKFLKGKTEELKKTIENCVDKEGKI